METNNSPLAPLVPAICGFVYGCTSVVIGQPFETVKTQLQTLSNGTGINTIKKIYDHEGINGVL